MDIISSGNLPQDNRNNNAMGNRTRRIFLIAHCSLLIALTLASISQSEPPPRITVTPKQVNLGVMKKDEVKLYKVIIGNKGKGNLYITNIPSPNEKTGIPLNKNAIKPGKKIELTFFYKGIDIGIIKDYVSIESNDPKIPSVKIILKGEVR